MKRRRGRWMAEPVAGSADAAAMPPLPEHLRGARRSGGRWVQPGADPHGRLRILRAVARRAWLVAMPVLGIMAANSYHVLPVMADIDTARAVERTRILDHKDALRFQIDALHHQGETIGAELDTLYMPMVTFHQAIHDSLMRMRSAQALPVTSAQIDSLRALRDELAGQVRATRADYWDRASVLENLAALQGALRDSMDLIDRLALAAQTQEPAPEKRGLTLRALMTHAGYVLAPVLGFMWAHDS